MATNIVTTDNSDTTDFGCRGGKFALNPAGVLRALDSDSNGKIDDAFLPAGLTVGDVTGDAAFCTAVEACLEAQLAARTFDCSALPAS